MVLRDLAVVILMADMECTLMTGPCLITFIPSHRPMDITAGIR